MAVTDGQLTSDDLDKEEGGIDDEEGDEACLTREPAFFAHLWGQGEG